MKQSRGPGINARLYSQLIVDKGAKNILWRKVSLLNDSTKLKMQMQKNETYSYSLTPYKHELKMDQRTKS
jgi:hypothetical protein